MHNCAVSPVKSLHLMWAEHVDHFLIRPPPIHARTAQELRKREAAELEKAQQLDAVPRSLQRFYK